MKLTTPKRPVRGDRLRQPIVREKVSIHGTGARTVLIIQHTTMKRKRSLLEDLRLENSVIRAETKKETKDARSSIAFIKTRKRT